MKLKISSAKFWIILGIVFVLFGFVLAHLSNVYPDLIHWSPEGEKAADFIFHKIGSLFILVGIVMWLVRKLRK